MKKPKKTPQQHRINYEKEREQAVKSCKGLAEAAGVDKLPLSLVAVLLPTLPEYR